MHKLCASPACPAPPVLRGFVAQITVPRPQGATINSRKPSPGLRELNPGSRGSTGARQEMVSVADTLPAARPDSDGAKPVLNRPLLAAEITAIGAGRRLYNDGTIGPDATVLTVLNCTQALRPPELRALRDIGERSFGICARAGVLYQQAAELLSNLR